MSNNDSRETLELLEEAVDIIAVELSKSQEALTDILALLKEIKITLNRLKN